MRHATEVDGPLTIWLNNGDRIEAERIDGGGAMVGGPYEIHGTLADGGFLCVEQRVVSQVVTAHGEEVEFGNPLVPDHPRHSTIHDS
jgi:hypothetical protein